MPPTPTISVITPAYNAAAFIARTVLSVQTQTVPVLEMLIIDDGSKDSTAEVAAACGAPVRVLRQSNAGPNAARNHGAREARGEWLAFLDADDAWLPQRLERQLRLVTPETTLVHAYCLVDPHTPKARDNMTFQDLWKLNTIGTSTVLLRRSAWEAAGGFDEDRTLIGAEDYNLWLRLLHQGHKFITCREPLIDYTPAPGSLSGQILRVIAGELKNLEKIRGLCDVSDELVRAKQVSIYQEYGDKLFFLRNMTESRRCYAQLVRLSPGLRPILNWLTTLIPTPLLDARRSLMTRLRSNPVKA